MSWRIYGILIIFALFVIILIFNPNLSCFGRRLKSPLYPLFRKKKQKKVRTEDYGFHLAEESQQQGNQKARGPGLSRGEGQDMPGPTGKKKKLKTQDYGFSLADDQDRQRPQDEKEEKD